MLCSLQFDAVALKTNKQACSGYIAELWHAIWIAEAAVTKTFNKNTGKQERKAERSYPMRIQTLVVCALLMVTPLANVLADPLSFAGLTQFETEQESVSSPAVREFDTSEIDSRLENVKTLIQKLCETYRYILLLTEKDDGECLITSSKSRFDELRNRCRHFNNKLDETRSELFSIDCQLNDLGIKDMSRAELMSLAQQIGRQTRYVTIYNSILEFAWKRKICYNTRRPFDEERIEFAEINGNYRQSFPNVFEKTSFFTSPKYFDYLEIYREQPLEEIEKTPREAFASASVEPLLEEGKALVQEAARIKEHLLSNGRERKEKDGTRRIQYDCSVNRFENYIKTEQVKFIQTTIELKAIRNEFVMNFILAEGMFPDNSLMYKWREMDGNHHNFILWGLKTTLTCGSHSSRFFLVDNYRMSFTIPQPATLQETYRDKRQQQLDTLAQMRSQGMITTAEALETLRNTEPAELMQKAVEVTEKIFDLTDSSKAAIKELVDSRMQDYWNDSVTSLPNPSENSD